MKESKKKMQDSEEKYYALINNINDLVMEIDSKGKFTYISPQIFDMFGYTPEESIGLFALSFVHPDDLEKCMKAMKTMDKVKYFEYRSRHKDGHYVHVSTSGKIIPDSGDGIKIVSVLRDITERKKAEEELKNSEKKYRDAFNQANFYKDLIAHDINNILHSILSGIQINEILAEQPDKLDALKKNIDIIKQQVLQGANLISNVRMFSQLEDTETIIQHIEICSILKNSITNLKNAYQNKNIDIQADFITEKFHVYANNLLEEVFENILINAIRHNENILVEITIKISKELKEGINYLKIEFIDNGLGVEDKRKEGIFQRGDCEDKSIHGMGLGLSLVKKIIALYRGEIWVEDRVKGDHSQGSNFIILIPEVA